MTRIQYRKVQILYFGSEAYILIHKYGLNRINLILTDFYQKILQKGRQIIIFHFQRVAEIA